MIRQFLLALAAAVTLAPHAAQAQTRDFYRPTIDGTRIDWCLYNGRSCGQPAADAFCNSQGFSRAAYLDRDDNIGRFTPTRILGTGQFCRDRFCDGFTLIRCEGRQNQRSERPRFDPDGGGVVPLRRGGGGQSRSGDTFYRPFLGGLRLDWCRTFGRDCGQSAANAFCRQQGLGHAVDFGQDSNIGAFSPTVNIGSGQVCNQRMCDGFSYITCGRGNLGGLPGTGNEGWRRWQGWSPDNPNGNQGGRNAQRFSNPRYQGQRIDWCISGTRNCGDSAADLFCRINGFNRSSAYQKDPHAGRFGATIQIDTGDYCFGATCDSFTYVDCVGDGNRGFGRGGRRGNR